MSFAIAQCIHTSTAENPDTMTIHPVSTIIRLTTHGHLGARYMVNIPIWRTEIPHEAMSKAQKYSPERRLSTVRMRMVRDTVDQMAMAAAATRTL
jgi:hypothetical protein